MTDPNDPKFIVAEKGDFTVTRAQLNSEVDSYLKQRQATREMVGKANIPYVETGLLRNIVLKKLLLDKAATMQLKDVDKETDDGLTKVKGPASDSDFAEQLKKAGLTHDELKQRIHDAVVIHKVMEAQAFKNVDPSEQEIDDIYAKNKERFNIPAKLRASRVLVLATDKDTPADKAAKKKKIDKAHDRVAKGEDFSKVATEVSEDRYSTPKGGDLNYFQRGENEPGFDDVAFKTKVNTVSPVFQTQLGYQFLKITDSQPAGTVSLADARAIIAPKLREMKMQEQSQAFAKNLLETSGVNFHLKLVDPPAQMPPPSGPGGAPAPGSAASGPAPSPAVSGGTPGSVPAPPAAPASEPPPAAPAPGK